MSEHGFLVLADISGFTRFLAGTGLEHGPRVIADLLGTVAAQLSPPLEIQEIEGDAVFTLGSERALPEPAMLLAIVERAFIAFKQRQREMVLDVGCTCQACASIPNLNVKFVGHYGSFIRQSVAGRAQVSGSDVIVVHRLLKNRVEGSRGYLLLTEPASIRAGQDPNDPEIRSHVEELDALGQVRCSVRFAIRGFRLHPLVRSLVHHAVDVAHVRLLQRRAVSGGWAGPPSTAKAGAATIAAASTMTTVTTFIAVLESMGATSGAEART